MLTALLSAQSATHRCVPSRASRAVQSVAGENTGETVITVIPAKAETNVYKYKIGDTAEDVLYGQNVRTWKAWDGVSPIIAEAGKTITVVEATKDYRAIASGSAVVVAG